MESIDQKEKDGKRGNGRENRIETRGKEPVGKGWGIREKGERDRRRRGRYTTLFRDGSRSGVEGGGRTTGNGVDYDEFQYCATHKP